MTAYEERERRYNEKAKIGYSQIMSIAKASPYASNGNGKQYVDFMVGQSNDKVNRVRVMIDFRGEYFSSFFLDCALPITITSPIRNRINFTAQEAYDYVVQKAREINETR